MIPYFKRADINIELEENYRAICVDNCRGSLFPPRIKDPSDKREVANKWKELVMELGYLTGNKGFEDVFFARAKQLTKKGQPISKDTDQRFYLTFKV